MQNKDRVLKLIEILKNESDEFKPLSTASLICRLEKEGLKVDRKTLYNDIESLLNNGYDIVKVNKQHSNYYYLNLSEFDIAELKIMLDAVESARFISAKKTDVLSDKLLKYAGKFKGELMARASVCFDTVKHSNDKIFLYTDILNDAILNKNKVSFLYYDFNVKAEKIYRKDKAAYVVNPVALVFSDGYYYLTCYNDKYQDLANFRVDKMEEVEKLDEKITPSDCVLDFKFYSHPKQSFSMFHGEIEKVTLSCENSMANIIIDKFGEKIKMFQEGERFSVTVPVQVSPPFFAWCFTFGKRLKIVSPQSVVDSFQSMLKIVTENYKI